MLYIKEELFIQIKYDFNIQEYLISYVLFT